MKFEIDTKNTKDFPWEWGSLAAFVWSVVLCSYSAVSGRLGDAPGIMIEPWLVGSISRYHDPFILGPLVTFTIWAWKHSPVSWEKVKEDRHLKGAVIGFLGFVLSLSILSRYISKASDLDILLLLIGVMLLTPFGFRGVLITSALFLIAFWIINGMVIVAITLPILYIGKWTIWWVVNIVRYRSFDKAYNKLKGRPFESVSKVPDSVGDAPVPASTA